MNFRKLLTPLTKISEAILELFFPPRCAICEKIQPKYSFKNKAYICPDCRKKLHFVRDFSEKCKKCSRPIDSDSLICHVCQVSQKHFDAAFSCMIYEAEIREALLLYKFGDARHKFRAFAEIMIDEMKNILPFPHIDVICRVPSGKRRKKQRGFDHTLEIAKYISKKTGLYHSPETIIKLKDTVPQSKLGFKERQEAVKGVFKIAVPDDIRGKSVLLIDDIYTTGATTSEISKLLKRAGATSVFVLTLCITQTIKLGDDIKI